ncbi:MAG TPA: GNAT family N-acetyltransferase [Acetobacteraceae bacterium]|jgi:ribosomal protein S18 acetylase RimI-like enzyme|nr:GNAT family N-acetyltransferase [Acetobacteraceae bacterium]
MAEIRAVRQDDLDALYRIALATGDGGNDAASLYRDQRLLGHIYAAPYAVLCPETVFVAGDAQGVGGYIVGAADTVAYEARLEQEWWPTLRAVCPDPAVIPPQSRTPDQRRMHMIHHPHHTPGGLTAAYPSHLHINLLPRLRGRGTGHALLMRWLHAVRQLGSTGVHLAVGVNNTLAIQFYQAHGFIEPQGVLPVGPGARWLVLPLPR